MEESSPRHLSYLSVSPCARLPVFYLSPKTADQLASLTPILPASRRAEALDQLARACEQAPREELRCFWNSTAKEAVFMAGKTVVAKSPFRDMMGLAAPLPPPLLNRAAPLPIPPPVNSLPVTPTQQPQSASRPRSKPFVVTGCAVQRNIHIVRSDLRARVLRIATLTDMCEEYLELSGLQATQVHYQEGGWKVCRIDIEGARRVEQRGERWAKARMKAVLEVMTTLDRGLCEEWLSLHTEYLAAHMGGDGQ